MAARYHPPQSGATHRIGEVLRRAHSGSRRSDANRQIRWASDLMGWTPQGLLTGRNPQAPAERRSEPNPG